MRTAIATVFIGLGTNLGDRDQNLAAALKSLQAHMSIEAASAVYESRPVDVEDQPWFLNMAVQASTELAPRALLAALTDIEHAMGRTRTVRRGPRIIDLDILFYSDKIISEEDLVIPHPRIASRGFVLAPLNEIAPEFRHPGLGKDIRTLYANLHQNRDVRLWTKQR